MSNRKATHDTFRIERNYNATPARVFAALSQMEHMNHWFKAPPEWGDDQIELDFRVGGGMRSAGGPKGGPVHKFFSHYYDIVENERIIHAYEMYLDDKRISVSVATFELRAAGKGCQLVLTEQGVFLDGFDDPKLREQGTQGLLDQLGKYVEAS
jgi:uncharacterized protein YndB with AHSA1/START domain